MFERFTDRARQAVAMAADEARELGADHVAPEHLLLGLLREEDGPAADILEDRDAIRERLLELRQARPERRRGKRAKLGRAAQDALTRARELAGEEGASEVGVEHLRRALDAPGPD